MCEGSPETTNRGTVTLRSSLNYALKCGYVSRAFWKNVRLAQERDQHEKSIQRIAASKADRKAILEAADPSLRPISECMYLTGCRPAEARRLRVEDVVLIGKDAPYVKFKTYKGGKRMGTSRLFRLEGYRLQFFAGLVVAREPEETLFLTPTSISK